MEILDRDNRPTDHILFTISPRPERGTFDALYLDDQSNPNFGPGRNYNPNQPTNISFRINNLLHSQVENTWIVTTYYNNERRFEAQWMRDEDGYSMWNFDGDLGSLTTFTSSSP